MGVEIDGVNNKIDLDDDKDTSISANVDDTLVVEVGGNTLATATATGLTINDGVTITTADNTDTLTLISTDTDANYGPNIEMSRPVTGATNDLLGRIDFSGQDTAGNTHNYFSIEAIIADATSGGEEGRFLLRTEVAGATKNMMDINGSEIVFNEDSLDYDFRVESNNRPDIFFVDGGNDKVGVGTDSPQERLHVFDSSTTCNLRVSGENNNNKKVEIGYDASNGPQIKAGSSGINTLKFFVDNTSLAMTIAANDVISGDFNDTSDIALKENIIDLENATEKLKQLKARMFDWKKEDKSKEVAGFIAQEVENIIPSAVVGDDYVETTFYTDDDDIPEDKKVGDTKVSGNSGKAINTSAILAYAVKTIQELEARIKTLEDA